MVFDVLSVVGDLTGGKRYIDADPGGLELTVVADARRTLLPGAVFTGTRRARPDEGDVREGSRREIRFRFDDWLPLAPAGLGSPKSKGIRSPG